MTFVFPVLLGGLVLVGVPVLLHLIMRQKPKVLRFPAFRFLVQRSKKNLRKLRLRHLLLLALRMFILALICLALAAPRLVESGLNLSTDRPVAAIFLFDTSASMDYQSSDKASRLNEAKKRGLEMLAELPEGSRIAILDSAETVASRGDWLASASRARTRIGELKPRPDSASVTTRLADAFRMFADLASRRDEEAVKDLPRLLCVFSDRTRACWEAGRLPGLHDAADQVPPTLPGLQRAGDGIPNLTEQLRELRKQLPPRPGEDYPEQALIDSLGKLRDAIPATAEDLGNETLAKKMTLARRPARTLLGLLDKREDKKDDVAVAYRKALTESLEGLLGNLRGYHGLFIDVGVDKPADLAITDIDFPRNPDGQPRTFFGGDEKILIQARVQATGQGYNSTLTCRIGKKTYQQPVVIKAGERQAVPFEIDAGELKLTPGPHQLELELKPPDLLTFNNVRYATFAVREPRRVLILADDREQAKYFSQALSALRYTNVVKSGAIKQTDLEPYQAVYLFEMAKPEAALWKTLADFVARGGGLGIIPGGKETQVASYNDAAASAVMPARLAKIIDHGDVRKNRGSIWNLEDDTIFQHPMLKWFRKWKDEGWDVVRSPRFAHAYWEAAPFPDRGAALVKYGDDKARPALLERLAPADKKRVGKVLLFTTTLSPRSPPWNAYLDSTSSFYVVLAGLATQYLVGDTDEANLNFLSGQGAPTVALPLSPRFPGYTLQGPDILEPVAVADGQNQLAIKQAAVPGNYALDGTDGGGRGKTVARFSVNIPGGESDLERVPPAEIDSLLGTGSVVPVQRAVNIRDALQGHFSQPVELFPFLMVLLLLILALENLLGNKFYRKEEPAAHV
ncbi:MAG: VWA domain-containing protein [Planctomycetes bacterium]|nr:VWA domain-containing protein [Planctomycetota bacterium]